MSEQDRTRELATYASHLNFDNLPVEVVEKAKTVILDTIAVILAASRYPVGRLITRFAQNQGGRPQATIRGGNCKVDSPSAAFANGTMAHDMDMDDLHEPTALHVAAAIVPAGKKGRGRVKLIDSQGQSPDPKASS